MHRLQRGWLLAARLIRIGGRTSLLLWLLSLSCMRVLLLLRRRRSGMT